VIQLLDIYEIICLPNEGTLATVLFIVLALFVPRGFVLRRVSFLVPASLASHFRLGILVQFSVRIRASVGRVVCQTLGTCRPTRVAFHLRCASPSHTRVHRGVYATYCGAAKAK